MRSLRLSFAVLVAAATMALAACGTASPGSASADTSASAASGVASDATPAISHFNAQLAAGYTGLKVAEIILKTAITSKSLSKPKAQAAQNQLKAYTSTLDTIRTSGETPANQTILDNTVLAIAALTTLTTAEGVLK